MKSYIFDREKDDYLRDEDGEFCQFSSNDEVYKYLHDHCQFKDEWIDKNFYRVMHVKILKVENLDDEFKPHKQ